MKNVKEYSTKDFYISACLLASSLTLKRLEKVNDKLVVFVFDDPNFKAEKIIQDHWNRNNRIPSRNLIEAINELKTRIHSGV